MESPLPKSPMARRHLATRIGLPAIALMMALPAAGRGTTSIYIIPCLQSHETVADLPIVVLQAPGDAVATTGRAFCWLAMDVPSPESEDGDPARRDRMFALRVARMGGLYGP